MAQPPAYNREKNFTLNSGRETDHAALNAELDRASNSINDIRSNLAILQADDGKLRPAVVTADSISADLRVSLVEGVVMDAQTMLEQSLAAADASSQSAKAAKKSEEVAKASSDKALESAKALSLAVNSDWNATEGAAQILNKPELSVVATSGSYDDLNDKPVIGGVPIGTISYFGKTDMPAGYLRATGQAVGRETYPELFTAIGTRYGEGDGTTTFNLPRLGDDIGAIQSFASLHLPTDFARCDGSEISRADYPELFAVIGTSYGEGDGQTTFNLPDLIDRFTQGSNTPGQKVEAGLPNVTGDFVPSTGDAARYPFADGALTYKKGGVEGGMFYNNDSRQSYTFTLDASRSNPIYGASDTVQPPALTVCYGIRIKNRLHAAIKAFDAATNPGLINITELVNDIQNAQTPAGTVAWFAMSAPPAGYLIANGAAVGRKTYPELYAAIGTTFGEGDGSTTFNLPDLINRFAQGSNMPGQKLEAGLPNIEGDLSSSASYGNISDSAVSKGALKIGSYYSQRVAGTTPGGYAIAFDASLSNPIYGASSTVQPPALTLLPCIKAFDAATNPGLIDMTGLANDVADLSANKLDKTISGKAVKYVTETYNDGTNWYRKWSDGWLEQGGHQSGTPVTLLQPFANTNYTILLGNKAGNQYVSVNYIETTYFALHYSVTTGNSMYWYACGQGAQS